MEAKTIPDRLDAIDAERFRDMVASPSFALLAARINEELERRRLSCERAEGADLFRAQGAVSGLRSVLAFPTMILKEIEGKRK